VDDRGSRKFYVADETNLWSRDQTGAVSRATDAVITDLFERASQLEREAEDADDLDDAARESRRERAASLRALARRSDTVRGRSSMAALGTDRYGLRVAGVGDFDRRKNLVACGDGKVLVLGDEDGRGWNVTVRRRELGDMCASVVNARYRPEVLDSPPDLVKQFVETFLPEDGKVELLFKLLGHALVGGNPHRYFVILRGGTTSGKTQLIMTLQRVLGRYAAASPASIFYQSKGDRPRPDIIRLYRRRYAILAEASRKSWELHASRIKQFTGGDQDPQRAMRSDVFVEETPVCLPIVYANELPRIIGADAATRRRILGPWMNQTLPKHMEDVSIRDRFINDEAVGEWTLAALVRGFELARRDGMSDVEAAFSLASEGDEVGDELYHLSDFLRWVKNTDRLVWVPEHERVYGDKSTYVTMEALYGSYVNWCKVFGDRYDRLEQLSLKDFNRELRDNHKFTSCKAKVHRWEGWRLQEVSLAELHASVTEWN
jgi:phage/plasmid-associated DNA primase